MAVDQEQPLPIEPDEHVDGLEVREQDRVLPSALPREYLPATTGARLHLERCSMDVDRVGRVAVGHEAPALHGIHRNGEVDSVDVVETAVDPCHAVEAEGPSRNGRTG